MLQDEQEVRGAVDDGSVDKLHPGNPPEQQDREARVLDAERHSPALPAELLIIKVPIDKIYLIHIILFGDE